MARRWHLEHPDGREWTRDELSRAVQLLRLGRYGGYRKTDGCQYVCIDDDGRPFLLDTSGEWWWLADYSDMVVTFDG